MKVARGLLAGALNSGPDVRAVLASIIEKLSALSRWVLNEYGPEPPTRFSQRTRKVHPRFGSCCAIGRFDGGQPPQVRVRNTCWWPGGNVSFALRRARHGSPLAFNSRGPDQIKTTPATGFTGVALPGRPATRAPEEASN